MWEYQGTLDVERSGVVDGDTLDLRVDLGFYTDRRIRVRLKDVDAHEIYGTKHGSEEYELGMEQYKFVQDWIEKSRREHDGFWPLIVSTEKNTGKYGRWIGDVERKCDKESLSEALIEEWPEVEE